MKKSLLLAIVGFATISLMQGADTPTQPAAGAAAPEFTLATSDGSQVSLKDFKGKWVVLYFYPKDMTSGCTIEAHNFQRDLAQYDKTGAVILGVSVDSAESHAKFAGKFGLPFPLLADDGGAVAKAYGALWSLGPIKFAKRHTFIVTPDGNIARIYRDVKPEEHSRQVMADVQALQQASR